jgi:hypothetical protein
MTVIATDTIRISNLVKSYDCPQTPEMCNEVLTVNEAAQQTYALGQVLGKITANGKYIISKVGAVDGSQNPIAVYIADNFGNNNTVTIPATTDTKIVALARGKVIVNAGQLVWDASYNTQPLIAAGIANLKTVGILAETQI